jgi:EF hand domain-containing protein
MAAASVFAMRWQRPVPQNDQASPPAHLSMENTMNNTNKPLAGLIALGTALVMPMAFAQTAPTTDDSAMQSAPTSQPQAQPAPAAQPKQVTWADLDGDKDGNLTKTEVATVPALSQVFDQADADANGKLTADEYKTFASKNSGAGSGNASGG